MDLLFLFNHTACNVYLCLSFFFPLLFSSSPFLSFSFFFLRWREKLSHVQFRRVNRFVSSEGCQRERKAADIARRQRETTINRAWSCFSTYFAYFATRIRCKSLYTYEYFILSTFAIPIRLKLYKIPVILSIRVSFRFQFCCIPAK